MLTISPVIPFEIIIHISSFHTPLVRDLIIQAIFILKLILIHLEKRRLLLVHHVCIERIVQILLLEVS